MRHLFDPSDLHDITKRSLVHGDRDACMQAIIDELATAYPKHIRRDCPWMFNNAGGAMGQMKLLHCSLTEYILLFGTPIGTEGHSGRYAAEVHDFMIDGEMWCFHAGETDRVVFKPGDAAFLGPNRAKGYRVPDRAWMLEYARGPIPAMLPFGIADSMLSTLDRNTLGTTIYNYGSMVVGNLLRGKI